MLKLTTGYYNKPDCLFSVNANKTNLVMKNCTGRVLIEKPTHITLHDIMSTKCFYE